jgi:hypothetical protein
VKQKVARGTVDRIFGIVSETFFGAIGPSGTPPALIARPPTWSTPVIAPRGTVPPLACTSIRPVPSGMVRFGTQTCDPGETPA